MADCKLYVDRAYYAIKDNDKLRRTFFKTNSDEYITTIQEIYWDIERACDRSTDDEIVFSCADDECKPTWTAYTQGDKIFICPRFFRETAADQARTLIHELTHRESIRGTDDHAYGDVDSRMLDEARCRWNADNYAWRAKGLLGRHNVVVSHLDSMGTISSASSAAIFRVSFPNIKLAFVVGILRAVSFNHKGAEILLGDVITSQYLDLMDRNDGSVHGEEFESVSRDRGIPRAMAQTFIISFEQIKQQHHLASHLLSLMSCFGRQEIPLELLARLDTDENKDEIEELTLQKAMLVQIANKRNGLQTSSTQSWSISPTMPLQQ
ncbi:hypothetical protein MCOR02_011962 [Pyricularia oryzae]|nr:hypothetical protein MCOR02_011962 [Pyricularia oryzae]KAI6487682.1 hypothetical protein MCOR13_009186 [Pyricularia oryzae]